MNKKKRFHLPAWIIIVVIILITLEIAPFILSYPLMHQGFRPGVIRNEIGLQSQTEQDKSGDTKEIKTEYLGGHILHPYLGYVHIPGESYNRLGFPGSDPLEATNNKLTGY